MSASCTDLYASSPATCCVAMANREASTESSPRMGNSLTMKRILPSSSSRPLTASAAVIHELDEGDVALGIAADPGVTIVENGVGIGAHEVDIGLRLTFGLTLFEHGHGLHDHLGVFQQVGADLGVQRGALGLGQVVEVEGLGGQGQGQAKGGGGDKASNHWVILRYSAVLAACSTSCARCHAADPRGSRPEARSAWILASLSRPAIA